MLAQYARNPIVKNYLYRMQERTKPLDVTQWYNINGNALPQHIRNKFFQSTFDDGTDKFLDNCYEKSDWLFTQIFHSMLRTLFAWFMSMTSVNGLLKRGSMFVFSEQQFQSLLQVSDDWKSDSMLDIGAGDGKVTEHVLHYFKDKYATEQSPTMRWRLQEKGFNILEIDEWVKKENYSVITALNLLDRIDHPMKLLRDMKLSIKTDGLIILAVVLPYNPCYETGPSFGPPSERLPICGDTVEEQIQSLHDDVFTPIGLEVVRFTRLPYLCEGDLHNDFFRLNDIVFTLRAVETVNSMDENEAGVCLVSKSL